MRETAPEAKAAQMDDIDHLQQQVDSLTDIVGTLVERATGDDQVVASTASPWSWRAMTGQARERLWRDLTGWVEWHNERYGQFNPNWTIHPCWFRHPPVVEHLTALMVAWRAAYETDRPSREAAVWHLEMDQIHTRMTGAEWGFKRCVGGHRDPSEQPTEQDPETLGGFISEDLARHPDGNLP